MPCEQPVTRREGAEQLLGRKRDVKEEPDPGVRAGARAGGPGAAGAGSRAPRSGRPGRYVSRDDVGEALVRLDVGVPVADLERHLVQEIVEERPQHAVREPLVEAADEVRRRAGPLRAAWRPARRSRAACCSGLRSAGGSGPADPEPVGVLVRPHEPGGEPAGAPLHLDLSVGGADGNGEPVGDDQEPGHPGKVIRRVG